MEGLGEALHEVWQNIPRTFLTNLIESVRRQCVTCANDSANTVLGSSDL